MKESRRLCIALMALSLSWGTAAHAQQAAASKQTQQTAKALSSQPSFAGAGLTKAVTGSGTSNFIPVWTGSSTISNSILSQSNTTLNVGGGLSAVSLSGNGVGVTNVNALTLGGLSPSAFAQLGAGSNTFTGSVSATSFSGNGSGLTNVNASMLGGLSSTAFAQLGTSNTFNADQTVNGHLTLSGSINNTLTLQGDLTDSSGNVSANVIGGFGGNTHFAGNSVASGVVGATIAGGGGSSSGNPTPNTVSADWGTVGGGSENTASSSATVAGGFRNTASGSAAAVGGGSQNKASLDFATVGGGGNNTASGLLATVGGGANNTASGTEAIVPGGLFNTAAGDNTFAGGSYANAVNNGSFVWGDRSTAGVPVSDSGPNQFVARAAGGVTFYSSSDLTTGATLASGSGSWSSLSDRNVKANFSVVDGEDLLQRLAALPIATWNYKAQPDSVRHMGPMAQDFREAFGLGEDEKHISVVDSEGVALAAVQALYREVSQKQQEITNLRAEMEKLQQVRDQLAALEARLALMEASR